MDNKERFIEIFTSQIHRPGAAELLEWLESTDFFEAPASTHYHGSYTGGLVEHSLNVYYELIGAGRVPGVPTAETYAVVALLHDICKADFYAKSTKNQKNSDGEWETVPCYTVREKFPFGHGEKSAFLAQRFMPLTDAEALAIRWHMGAYDDAAKGGSKVLSAAMAATPLVYARGGGFAGKRGVFGGVPAFGNRGTNKNGAYPAFAQEQGKHH